MRPSISALLVDLAGALLLPLSLAAVGLVLGCLLYWRGREGWGRRLVLAGTALLLLLGYGCPSGQMLRWLEHRYPAVDPAATQHIRWIVVLGAGHRWQPGVPVSSLAERGSLSRILEGVRLHRAIPSSRLVFTGGPITQSMSTARAGAEVAQALGVAADAITIDDRPRSTAEEALAAKTIVAGEPLLLVTSAAHMPRAMMLFERAGLKPIAAPTDFRSSPTSVLFPSPVKIAEANDTAHELMGIAWAWLGGGSPP